METIGRRLAAKKRLAGEIVAHVLAAGAPGAEALAAELAGLELTYALETSPLFLQASSGESGRLAARADFERTLAATRLPESFDRLVARARGALLGAAHAGKRTPPPGPPAPGGAANAAAAPAARKKTGDALLPRKARELLTRYEGDRIDCPRGAVDASIAAVRRDFASCADCGLEMVVAPDTSELACPGCGLRRGLVGTVFDDAQFYNQEGQKAKSGSSGAPHRHFHFWMDHILAREPVDEIGDRDDPANAAGEKVVAAIRVAVAQRRLILRHLSPGALREILKFLGRTDLNKNVPLLLRHTTGIGPPAVPEAINQRAERLFIHAIAIWDELHPDSSRKYYPFYIYKIYDAILPPDDHENRRILFYIYLQGDDTLEKNDGEWAEICAHLPEISWRPTDRSQARRYRPS
jgi:hypothetical protein